MVDPPGAQFHLKHQLVVVDCFRYLERLVETSHSLHLDVVDRLHHPKNDAEMMNLVVEWKFAPPRWGNALPVLLD